MTARDDDVLLPAEVAEMLRCTERTVTAMCKDGRLAGFRVGTHWRITREAVDAYKHGVAA